MSSAEKDAIVPNIVTEVNSDGEGSSQENRARNRMVAEGYKYHALNNNGHSDVLGNSFIDILLVQIMSPAQAKGKRELNASPQ